MALIIQLGYAADVHKWRVVLWGQAGRFFRVNAHNDKSVEEEDRCQKFNMAANSSEGSGFSALILTERSFYRKAWFTVVYYLSSSQDGWLWRRCWMGWSRRELIFCNIFPLFLPVALHKKAKPQNTRPLKYSPTNPVTAVRSAVKRNKHTIHLIYFI